MIHSIALQVKGKNSDLTVGSRRVLTPESTTISSTPFNMAETLSPFVYWGQTSDVIFLKIALRNTEVSEMLGLHNSTSSLSMYFRLKSIVLHVRVAVRAAVNCIVC